MALRVKPLHRSTSSSIQRLGQQNKNKKQKKTLQVVTEEHGIHTLAKEDIESKVEETIFRSRSRTTDYIKVTCHKKRS